MSLKCAVELGIPEAIHAHSLPMTLPLLAAAVSLPTSKAPCLARLLHMLEHSDFFAKLTNGSSKDSYALTPSSSCILRGASRLVRGILQPPLVTPWLHLSSWFHTDASNSFLVANRASIFEYAGKNPEFNGLFNVAMAIDSMFVTREIVEKYSYVFDGLASVVDVGGGNGAVVRALVARFVHLRCIVFDLAHIVTAQEPSERVEFVHGNMFDHIPPANAVFLKMIAVTGGKERGVEEWKKIINQAGFAGYKITPLSFLYLIEPYP